MNLHAEKNANPSCYNEPLQPGTAGYDPDLCWCHDCKKHYYPDLDDRCLYCEGNNVVNLDDLRDC